MNFKWRHRNDDKYFLLVDDVVIYTIIKEHYLMTDYYSIAVYNGIINKKYLYGDKKFLIFKYKIHLNIVDKEIEEIKNKLTRKYKIEKLINEMDKK